jgi:hypothetical protein
MPMSFMAAKLELKDCKEPGFHSPEAAEDALKGIALTNVIARSMDMKRL